VSSPTFCEERLVDRRRFEPVESDKLWHQTMKVASTPSRLRRRLPPALELNGDMTASLTRLAERSYGPHK
jgi:hypothetical protein